MRIFLIIFNANYMKTISCKDMGIDCPWVGKGKDMDELVMKAKEHAMQDHKEYWDETMSKMSDDEMKEMMKPHVKDEM
jgi:predicted small metal-binding protein